MERKKISQIFYTAIFLAAISLVFSAGCASSGSGVQTSLAKTNVPSSTGKIYSVTLESGEKQRMTDAEFRAYQNAQDAKEKQPQTPTAQKGKKEEVTPSTTSKKVEKIGKKEGQTKTSTRTYTEAEYKSALLDARVEDKGQIADLTKTKNEQANRVRVLEAENAQLSAQVQQLQERRSASSESRTTTGRPTQQIYPLTEVAIWIGYFVLGVGAIALLYWASIALFKALFSVVTWVTLCLVIPTWWLMGDGLTAVAVGGGFLFIALTLRWWKQRKAHKKELLKTPVKSASTAEELTAKERPVPQPKEETPIQEPDGAGDGLTPPPTQVDPAPHVVSIETPNREEREQRPRQTQVKERQQEKENNKKRRKKNRHQTSNRSGPKPGAKTNRV